MRTPSNRILTNVAAPFVLLATPVALIAVPHHLLRPISLAAVACSALGVVGIRTYMRRLESVVVFITTHPGAAPENLLVALLYPTERRLLRVPDHPSAQEATSLLRHRQSMLFHMGMAIAIPGFCAFLVVAYLFS